MTTPTNPTGYPAAMEVDGNIVVRDPSKSGLYGNITIDGSFTGKVLQANTIANVPPSGDPSGLTDGPKIRNIISQGGIPMLTPGQIYYADQPLVLPPLGGIVSLPGVSTLAYYGGSTAMPLGGAIVKAGSAFAGITLGGQAVNGILAMVSQVLGGYSTGSGNQTLRGVTVDGRGAPAGVNGLEAWGPVWGVNIDNVGIYGAPNFGMLTSSSTPDGTGKAPDLWRTLGLHIAAAGSDGWNNVGGHADSYIGFSEFTGNGGNGVSGGGFGNSRFVGTKFEFNTGRGISLNPPGVGNAGALGTILHGCSTDHNGLEGYYVYGANGRGPVCLDGCTSHGDGFALGATTAGVRNNSTFGYVICSNLRVLTVSGATPFPAYGLRCDIAGAILSIDSGVVYGNTAATYPTGAGTVTLGATVLTGTGAWGT